MSSRAKWWRIGLAGLLWAGAGACGGGGGSAPSYTPVSTTVEGNLYTMSLGPLKMVVDGARGARIVEFSYEGTDVLVGRETDGTNYGSTYWPSPQSSWCAAGGGCWPPIAAIDTQAYSGQIDDQTKGFYLLSETASIAAFPASQVSVLKTFTPIPESGAIDVTYSLVNGDPPVSLAPWQISRVATGGLTFFGQGTGDVTYAPDSDPAFTVTEADGSRWYQFAPVSLYSKALADGTGWLGHVTPDGLLYLTSYPDIPPADAAPGEAEVEIFTSGDYVEIESQGALAPLDMNDTSSWTVRWKLRRVPSGTTVAPGSADLAAFASDTLAE